MSKRAELRMTWSKREHDYVYRWDRSSHDGAMLHCIFDLGAAFFVRRDGERRDRLPSIGETVARLRAELDRRGFDPDTLTISVRRKRSA